MSILFEAWRRARGEGEEVARALGAPPRLQATAGRAVPWILTGVLAALVAGLAVYVWRLQRPHAPVSAATRVAPGAAMPAAATVSAAKLPATAAHGAAQAHAARPAAVHRTAGGTHARAEETTAAAAVAPRSAPDAVRQALPALPVTVHVWNPSPAARFVVVRGHMFHEGDELAPGVRLVQITRGGEVVRFRGYDIRLGGA